MGGGIVAKVMCWFDSLQRVERFPLTLYSIIRAPLTRLMQLIRECGCHSNFNAIAEPVKE